VAASALALLVTASLSTASAYTVIGAYFHPDHGSTGTKVVVSGLPLAVDCPTVDVWLATDATPSPPIVSSHDPRLIKLRGTTRHPSGGSGIGTGGSALGTEFVFRVPAIAPGTYGTYSSCPGGTAGFDGIGPGDTTFTVDPTAPSTDTAAADDRVVGSPGMPRVIVGLVAGLILLVGIAVRRRSSDRRFVDSAPPVPAPPGATARRGGSREPKPRGSGGPDDR
jgi:hypothetical protein